MLPVLSAPEIRGSLPVTPHLAPLKAWISAGRIQHFHPSPKSICVYYYFLPARLTMSNPVHIFSKRAQFVYLSAVGVNAYYVWGDQKINGLTRPYDDPFPIPVHPPARLSPFCSPSSLQHCSAVPLLCML